MMYIYIYIKTIPHFQTLWGIPLAIWWLPILWDHGFNVHFAWSWQTWSCDCFRIAGSQDTQMLDFHFFWEQTNVQSDAPCRVSVILQGRNYSINFPQFLGRLGWKYFSSRGGWGHWFDVRCLDMYTVTTFDTECIAATRTQANNQDATTSHVLFHTSEFAHFALRLWDDTWGLIFLALTHCLVLLSLLPCSILGIDWMPQPQNKV